MDLLKNPYLLKSNRFETTIWVSKLVLMSMGILSTLFLLKVAIIPLTLDLVLSTFPRLWVSARTFFSPPFVYVIVNFIIITIAASSNFHHHKNLPFSDSSISDPKHAPILSDIAEIEVSDNTHIEFDTQNQINEQKEEEEEEEKTEDSVFVKGSSFPSPENLAGEEVTEPESDDSMEGTWRAIMRLKKSDTWTERIRKAEEPLLIINDGDGDGDDDGDENDDAAAWAKRELRKSETFNDTASLRREKSMSPEELNKRAEAFIKDFNNQIKLQRLQSLQRFMEMTKGRPIS